MAADRRRLGDQRRPVRPGLQATPATSIAEKGDDTPIEWVHRDDRFGEKLATPDTSIADLIGEVDPIKVAEGRYLSDELTLHYGLVPRTNRGIFAINELPDLAERIQVGLLNVLEERDVQIRGYKVRLPLDVMLVASANPEDYTNRGRIITPLKDRFGAQIRTHYPLDVEHRDRRSSSRRRGRSTVDGVDGRTCPTFMAEIVATLSATWPARAPTSTSAPACRCASSVANYETLVANAVRRALRLGETDVVPRVSDLDALVVVHRRQGRDRDPRGRARRPDRRAPAEGGACSPCSRSRCAHGPARATSLDAFDDGDRRPRRRGRRRRPTTSRCSQRPAGLRGRRSTSSPAATRARPPSASAVEFVLEGLHLSKRLNKDAAGARATYRGR